MIEDPPLARALYATVDIDETIPPAHFEAVAKIIGFILSSGSPCQVPRMRCDETPPDRISFKTLGFERVLPRKPAATFVDALHDVVR